MNEHVGRTDYRASVGETGRRELVWGYVREPAVQRVDHQSVIMRTTMLLDLNVRTHALGLVCVSPDVVLDGPNALILQPDVIFVSNDRKSIVRDQVLGAPDLVVDVVASQSDRALKVSWYAQYGVRECWLVDPVQRSIAIVNLENRDEQQFAGDARVASRVLPLLDIPASEFFE